MTTSGDRLRPTTFDDYIGQTKMKERLFMHATAALAEGRPMGNVFLEGPPGCGKTTLSKLVAGLLQVPFMTVVMPFTAQDYRDLRDFCGVLFLDEIHRASTSQQEELLPMIDSGYMVPNGQARMELMWLTVIAATTEPRKMIPALLGDGGRFTIRPHFDDYTSAEMLAIVTGMAGRIGLHMSTDDLMVLGTAACGQPRAAAGLVETARDMQVAADAPITAHQVLAMCRITEDGLGVAQVEYLDKLFQMDQPVGMALLRQFFPLTEAAILDLERMLLGLDLIERTGQGRLLTSKGRARARQLNGSTRP